MEAKRDRDIIAIILMAGSGRRMRITEKKQFLLFHGKPLFCVSVESFLSWGRCGEILLVINEEDRRFVESVVEKEGWRSKTELHLVEGGAERFLSVYQALQFLKKKSKEGILLFMMRHVLFLQKIYWNVYGKRVGALPQLFRAFP